MSGYMLARHGGSEPQAEGAEKKASAAWMSWIKGVAANFPDPGAPAGESTTVTASGVIDNGGPNPLSGYGLVQADTLETAIEIAKDCPILEDGGSVEIASVHEM